MTTSSKTNKEVKDWRDFKVVDNEYIIPNWSINSQRGDISLSDMTLEVGKPIKTYFESVYTQAKEAGREEGLIKLEKMLSDQETIDGLLNVGPTTYKKAEIVNLIRYLQELQSK